VARAGIASLFSVAAGFLVWVGFGLAAGVGEAWNQSTWWWLGPLAIVAGLTGFLVPAKVWRWPMFIAVGQIIGMVLMSVLRTGSNLGLLPIMVIFVMVPLVIVLTVPALIGGTIARGGWDRRLLV
jgi:hypothetical protein